MGSSNSKESACEAGDLGSIPGREDPVEEGVATTPVFLPGESHGQGSLAGYSTPDHKELNTTGRLTLSLSNLLYCMRLLSRVKYS